MAGFTVRPGSLEMTGFARKVICRRLLGALELRGTWRCSGRSRLLGRTLIAGFDMDVFDRNSSSLIVYLALLKSWKGSVIKVAFVARIYRSCKLQQT